jgi:hypothetical protein
MNYEKNKLELTEGSKYKITSLGGRDQIFETEGVFKGFISIGVDETGVLMQLSKSHGVMAGKIRIVPLHVILLIDVVAVKENNKKEDYKGMSHYVG